MIICSWRAESPVFYRNRGRRPPAVSSLTIKPHSIWSQTTQSAVAAAEAAAAEAAAASALAEAAAAAAVLYIH